MDPELIARRSRRSMRFTRDELRVYFLNLPDEVQGFLDESRGPADAKEIGEKDAAARAAEERVRILRSVWLDLSEQLGAIVHLEQVEPADFFDNAFSPLNSLYRRLRQPGAMGGGVGETSRLWANERLFEHVKLFIEYVVEGGNGVLSTEEWTDWRAKWAQVR